LATGIRVLKGYESRQRLGNGPRECKDERGWSAFRGTLIARRGSALSPHGVGVDRVDERVPVENVERAYGREH
jgi:hypothetical protein